MKLTMLGTGNALVTEVYNTCFVIDTENESAANAEPGAAENDHLLLVDGGGGSEILSRLKKAGIDCNDIHHIFVTHKHIDHLLGIIWMVRVICQQMGRGYYKGEAYIYSHEEVIGLIREMTEKLLNGKEVRHLDKELHLVAVEDGQTMEIMGHEVTFFDIGSTKAKQFGFRVALDAENSEYLTCCGDEPYNERERVYTEGSKWLLHEAFCMDAEADVFKPYEKHHSTAKDAAELAQSLGVKNLLLYHTEDKNIARRKELYTEEAQKYFTGNVFVPEDLEEIEL